MAPTLQASHACSPPETGSRAIRGSSSLALTQPWSYVKRIVCNASFGILCSRIDASCSYELHHLSNTSLHLTNRRCKRLSWSHFLEAMISSSRSLEDLRGLSSTLEPSPELQHLPICLEKTEGNSIWVGKLIASKLRQITGHQESNSVYLAYL